MHKNPKLNLKDLSLGYSQSQKVFDFILAEPETIYQTSRSGTERDIVERIRQGLPKQAINNILAKTGVSKAQLSQVLHISTRQMDRYETMDRLPAEQSNFLYEFGRVYTRGLDILGDAVTVDNWLTRSSIALGGKTPLELMDTSEGIRMVDDLLSQVEYGFYS